MTGLRSVGVLLLLVSAAHGQSGDQKKEVLQADAAYRDAILRGDVAVLAAIMNEDIVIVHSDGTADDRANFLEAISSGRLKLQSYERSNVSIRIHGSTALLLSQTRKHFTYKGSPATDEDMSLVTYVKEGTRWRMVAMQNTHRSN
ncbi:MAG: nuclear transport factor 2 family protein [Bryobacteraceae bacterium]|jgi:ketosteroid isomerase-like protein